jgi:hypothetical protein
MTVTRPANTPARPRAHVMKISNAISLALLPLLLLAASCSSSPKAGAAY